MRLGFVVFACVTVAVGCQGGSSDGNPDAAGLLSDGGSHPDTGAPSETTGAAGTLSGVAGSAGAAGGGNGGKGGSDGAAGQAGTGDTDPPWVPPTPAPRAVPSCEGVALSCSTADGCTGLGCTNDSSCRGSSYSCYSRSSHGLCISVQGCVWSSSNDRCSGSAWSCSSYHGSSSCNYQPGCHWNSACGGSATPCSQLGSATCESQLGCSLDCELGKTLCDSSCVDTLDDEQHCGACNFDCGPRSDCSHGQCTCGAPYIVCGGRCIDPNNDEQYCGGCGNHCGSGFVCDEGTCSDIDECAGAPCHDGRTCSNKPGGFTCSPCAAGYVDDAAHGCNDVDECLVGNAGCAAEVSCTNTPGSFTCGACPSGYSGSGKTSCKDINECATNNGGCGAAKAWKCTNSIGSFSCSDIDECATNNGGCGNAAAWQCTNTQGSYGCSDIDECATGNGGCDPVAPCNNTQGGFSCGACPSGYTGSGDTSCNDINECAVDNGGCGNATFWKCTNTAGSHTCSDIDECATNHGGCDALAACTNTQGGFTCGACPSGYSGDGYVGCTDINECSANNGGCGDPTFYTCTNYLGTYACGDVNECAINNGGCGNASAWKCTNAVGGYGCSDINECATNNGGCGNPNAWKCTNSVGSYACSDIDECASNNGGCGNSTYWSCTNYTGGYSCSDIDECTLNHGGCDALASCTNTMGGYTCGACPSGYSGTGYLGCSDIDECASNNGGCGSTTAWTCANTPGSRTCADVDECLTSNGGCDVLTSCTNTVGSRVCSACPASYARPAGVDDACMPALDALGVSAGTLSPAFDPAVTSYVLRLPLGAQTVALTPSTSTAGATITVDGGPVSSGNAWTSPALNLGANNLVTITVTQAGRAPLSYTVSVERGYQEAYIKASNTDFYDSLANYGAITLSSDGNTLAVGAPHEDRLAVGVNGQSQYPATSSGAVYVFVRSGSVWSQQAYIKASNTEPEDFFGLNLALSDDGNTLAVTAIGEDSAATGIDGDQLDASASFSGAVYVFARSAGTWSQQAYVKASNAAVVDYFGYSLDLSTNGDTLAVGAYQEDSGATGVGGDQADNSVVNSGAVYVFTRSGTVWSQQAYVKASKAQADLFFGVDVAVSGDGNTLAVGAYGDTSHATGVGGNQLDTSAAASGAVFVFLRTGSVWAQQAYVKASNTDMYDRFGTNLALASDGNTLAAGAGGEASNATGVGGNQSDNSADGSGAVYVYTRTGSAWSQQAYVKASNTEVGDTFGELVALSPTGETLVVGPYSEDSSGIGVGASQSHNGAADSGAIYVYKRTGSAWSQQAYIKASNSETGDRFGTAVAVSANGDTIVAGASGEDSAATGIGGNQADNSADSSGAVYVFR